MLAVIVILSCLLVGTEIVLALTSQPALLATQIRRGLRRGRATVLSVDGTQRRR